jgi:hypothetical protein
MREPPSLAEFFGQRGSNTSGIGTFRTWRDVRVMTASCSKADITRLQILATRRMI